MERASDPSVTELDRCPLCGQPAKMILKEHPADAAPPIPAHAVVTELDLSRFTRAPELIGSDDAEIEVLNCLTTAYNKWCRLDGHDPFDVERMARVYELGMMLISDRIARRKLETDH